MPRIMYSTKSRLIKELFLLLLVGCSALVVSGLSSLAGTAKKELSRQHPAQVANTRIEQHGSPPSQVFALTELNRANASANEDQIEVETITVEARGFSPREITRPHGPFMLALSNHSGNSERELRLDRVAGNRMHQVRLPKGRTRWTQILNLPPGDYVLSEQNHPNWTCLIKLAPR